MELVECCSEESPCRLLRLELEEAEEQTCPGLKPSSLRAERVCVEEQASLCRNHDGKTTEEVRQSSLIVPPGKQAFAAGKKKWRARS